MSAEVQPGPQPMSISVQIAEDQDHEKWIVLSFGTVGGIGIYFIKANEAEEFARGIIANVHEAKSGLVIPTSDEVQRHIRRVDDNEN